MGDKSPGETYSRLFFFFFTISWQYFLPLTCMTGLAQGGTLNHDFNHSFCTTEWRRTKYFQHNHMISRWLAKADWQANSFWKKEQEEMKRPEDLRVFQKRGDHQRFSSNVTNPAQRGAAEIAIKTVNDCHTPADHFCRLSRTQRTPASGVCVCAFVCVSAPVLIWILYESVWKWPAECTHPRRIMETVDYFLAASKKRL